jgi:hypothetical protein
MGLELAQPDHHLKMWCNHHTPPPPKPAGELEGHKRFKISLEVVALDDLAPLTVALDGDATILSPATADELVVDVGHHDA